MLSLTVFALSITLASDEPRRIEPESEADATAVVEEAGPNALLRCELRTSSAKRSAPVVATLHPIDEGNDAAHGAGALGLAARQRRLALTLGPVEAKRPRRVFESDRPELSASCAENALVLSWKRPRRAGAEGSGRASLRLVPKNGGLVAEDADRLSSRLERSWSDPDGREGQDGEDLASLSALLDEVPPNEIGLHPSLPPAARVAAAKQALARNEWALAEELLDRVNLRDPELRLRAPWKERLVSLRRELASTRAATQPLKVGPGKPIPLGAKQLTPTPPPQPMADVFWRSNTEVCVPQEERIPATHMRCFDVSRKKWSAREPLRRPRDEVELVGSIANGCGFQNVCWHPSLPRGEDPCAGVACEELIAVLPGPSLIVARPEGLFELRNRPNEAQARHAATGEELARLPGSALTGGTLYFHGPLLFDATTGRSWKPFAQALPKAQGALVSPDGQWALVWTLGTARAPVPLFAVPLARR